MLLLSLLLNLPIGDAWPGLLRMLLPFDELEQRRERDEVEVQSHHLNQTDCAQILGFLSTRTEPKSMMKMTMMKMTMSDSEWTLHADKTHSF